MLLNSIEKYLRFVHANKRVYFVFNKQLLLGGFAGLFSGIAVAEVVALFTRDEITISLYSGIADYVCSILGFFAVYYFDNKSQYKSIERTTERIWRVTKPALSLWPTVVAADIVYIVMRPYVHSVFLSFNMEPGVSAALAHFIGVGIFNGVAIISRSIIDYIRALGGDMQEDKKTE